MRTHLLGGTTAACLLFATGLMAQTPTPAPDLATSSKTTDQPDVSPTRSAPAAPALPDSQAAPAGQAPDSSATQGGDTMAPKAKHHRLRASSAVGGEHWAHEPGTGMSGPASSKASNIDTADTRSDIAPHLPEPAMGAGGDPQQYLKAASTALDAHKTGAAQQALEMAETRLLDRSTPVSAAGQPTQDPAVQNIATARKALASGDTAGAKAAIQTALTAAPGTP